MTTYISATTHVRPTARARLTSVYRFTLEAVRYLFDQGCHLVILACNTASAKALRTIQQNDLPLIDPDRRVLGVIRPTVEKVGEISRNGNIGIVGTPGTIRSGSYELEIAKLHPTFHTYTQACPMWVPLVEKPRSLVARRRLLRQAGGRPTNGQRAAIDTIILGCTHYPLLYDKIRRYVPESARVLPQGEIVAESLVAYLKRHPEMEAKCSKGGTCSYRTTESPDKFAELASLFIGAPVTATQIDCL